MAAQHTQIATNKNEYRWSFRKKGKDVLKLCRQLTVVVTVAGGLTIIATPAQANPSGGNVTAGSATISSSGTTTTIHQTSGRAIIEWSNFDIAAGETTQFIQPSTSAIALNRVVNSNQATSINGNLTANGRVLVINPNGVLIGQSGNVDVSGFVASTADIDNTRFMTANGAMEFDRAGKLDASVENQGRITIRDAGLGLLVAPVVRNSGVIEGNMAKLQMGAGDTFGVDMYGDGLLHLAVGNTGGARTIKAENTGTIVAQAGKVVMTAAAANNVVNSVINTSGVIEAKGLVNKGGEIILTGAGAKVQVAGKVDASGKTGGGTVKIGGDVKGADTLAKAKTVDVAVNAQISADAGTAGDGGTIAVWSDELTTSRGSYSAKGGSESGNGGFVETSSKETLDVAGTYVDTSAAFGAYGLWLLDPTYFSINNSNISAINNATSDVLIYSLGEIDVEHDINMINTSVSLSLEAWSNINILNQNITLNGGDLSMLSKLGNIKIRNSSFITKGGDVDLYSVIGNIDINNSNINTTGGNNTASVDLYEGEFLRFGKAFDKVFNAANSTLKKQGKAGNVTMSAKDIDGNSFCIAAGGSGCGYVLTPVKTKITIQANDQTKIYGNADPALSYTLTYGALNAGDTITLKRDAGENVLSNGHGFYRILLDTLTNAANYDYTFIEGKLYITPKTLTITALDQGKTYGDELNLDLSKYTVNGLVTNINGVATGDQVTGVSLTSAKAGDKTTAAGTYSNDIAVSGASGTGLSNYAIQYVDGKLTVEKAALTVIASNRTKTYGNSLTMGNTAFTTDGLKNSDVVNTVTLNSSGRTAGASVSTYAITAGNAQGVGLSNYTINYVNGTLTVNPATLTITARDQYKVYGDSKNVDSALLPVTVSGLKNFDFVSGINLTSSGGAATANVGGYDIVANGATGWGLSNYNINYVNGTLHVTPALLVITADSFSKTYGDLHTFDNSDYGVYGLKNADTVTGVNLASNGAAATANVGLYGIFGSNATGTGLSNYNIVYTPGLMLVNPAALSVTALDQSKTYGTNHDLGNTAFAVSGLKNSDTVDTVALNSSGAAGTANAGSYAITSGGASGSGLSNYVISYNSGTLTVNQANLSVVANNQTKNFGSPFTFNGTEFTTVGALYNGDTVNTVTLTSPGEAANASAIFSPYNIYASNAMGTGLGNYNITYVNGQMTVNPAPYTPNVTFDSLNRPIVSVANKVIVRDTAFEGYETQTSDVDVALRYRGNTPTATAGNAAAVLAALEPAAGGDDVSAEDLANLEPAAGGDDTPVASGNSDVDCANSFLDNQPCGLVQ